MKKKIYTQNNKKDKMLTKVEKYVDKERESISENISNKKQKRKNKDLGDVNLEVMISRLKENEKCNKKWKSWNIAKWLLYIVYIIIIASFLYICLNYIISDWPH